MEAQEHKCPVCGTLNPSIDGFTYNGGRCYWNGVRIPLSITESRLLYFLYSRLGRIQSKEDIVDFIYVHERNGGPDNIGSALVEFVRRVRYVLFNQSIHLRLVNEFKIGYVLYPGDPLIVKPVKPRKRKPNERLSNRPV